MADATAPARTLPPPPKRKKYIPAVGPKQKKLLAVLLGAFALLGVNSLYLGTITFLGWAGRAAETPFYHLMLFGHVALGALITVPTLVFAGIHWKAAHDRPNRRAVRAGLGLLAAVLVMLVTGFLLARLNGISLIESGAARDLVYWAHVVSPLLVVWLFVLHRLAGKRIRWKVGLAWAAVAVVFAGVMAALHGLDPRREAEGLGKDYFHPSLARTDTGKRIPAEAMLNDRYCLECHPDTHRAWSHSVHKFSSFNNPAYLVSVQNTRKAMKARHGDITGSRWCAGCHDPVPFFSGRFDDEKFADADYDLKNDSQANAGITCTVCHSITNVNSTRGNAAYTIEEAQHYPFAFSENPVLKWINKQMILSKPAFHKKTFLKPLHKTAEFCSTCHKVHLPPELNDYKWLRGQNHYDPFFLSGPGGNGVTSFYYPPKAEPNCNSCHMPMKDSHLPAGGAGDFGAKDFAGVGTLQVHDHMFPTANTAIPFLTGMPAWVNEAHAKFQEGVLRVDLFGVREGGTIDGALTAPLRPQVPALQPGKRYLLETVIRTVKMGHVFTQGTADSNEVWLDVTVRNGDRVIGRSGGMKPDDRDVDPWSHFVNAFVIDRNGNRIDRRNPEDIFLPLYSNQIPPGAGQVVHYSLDVPKDARGEIAVDVVLRYRKFDTTYMKVFQGKDFKTNDLPILTLAKDRVVFPVGDAPAPANPDSPIPLWQRWNDYGIGSLLKGGDVGPPRGELKTAEEAFAQVEALKRFDGPLNRARVYIREGRLDEAVAALQRAAEHKDPAAPPWSIAWFTGLVNKQNGNFDAAIENFLAVATMDSEETRKRGFDFSKDYRLLTELGRTYFERAKQERGDARRAEHERLVREAVRWYHEALKYDSEHLDAHFGLAQAYEDLGDGGAAEHHRSEYARYKPDDNAADKAIAAARKRYPAADKASEAVVIYDLQRDGAYELPPAAPPPTPAEAK